MYIDKWWKMFTIRRVRNGDVFRILVSDQRKGFFCTINHRSLLALSNLQEKKGFLSLRRWTKRSRYIKLQEDDGPPTYPTFATKLLHSSLLWAHDGGWVDGCAFTHIHLPGIVCELVSMWTTPPEVETKCYFGRGTAQYHTVLEFELRRRHRGSQRQLLLHFYFTHIFGGID